MRVPSPGHGVNSTPLPFYSPGITIKGALTVRFSDLTLFRRMTTRQLASSSLCAKVGPGKSVADLAAAGMTATFARRQEKQ